MIRDLVRVSAYTEAIKRVVTPNTVVVDIGAGIGTFALLACKFGARKVYAIEPSEVIQLARELVEANGFGDRVQFLQAMSTEIELPEKADLLVSDLRGSCPLFGNHIPSIIDARLRFLKPTGVMAPMVDRIQVAAVQAPQIAEENIPLTSWSLEGLDLGLAREYVTNQPVSTPHKPEFVLSEIQSIGQVDYRCVETADFEGSATAIIQRDGVMHGLCLWFESETAPGIGYSTSMRGEDYCVYGSFFLPWSEPVRVKRGFILTISISAKFVGGDYVWRWNASTRNDRDSRTINRMSQSSVLGLPISLERLKKRAQDFVPTVNEKAHAMALAIEEMNGDNSVQEIAQILKKRFPERFSELEDARKLVGDIAHKFCN